jgi:hypothetical protein
MFTNFVNMMIVKFPPYLRCSIVILDSSTVLDAWADYFEDLATPSEQQSFDSTFLALVNDDVDILTEIFTKYRQPMQEVTASISSGTSFPFS